MSIKRNSNFRVEWSDKTMWTSLPHNAYQPTTAPLC